MVENIPDLIKQPLARLLNRPQILLPADIVLIFQQHGRNTGHGVDRRPQLMGYIGQKIFCPLIGLFQLCDLLHEIRSRTFAVRNHHPRQKTCQCHDTHMQQQSGHI